jgi:hypothetical protein
MGAGLGHTPNHPSRHTPTPTPTEIALSGPDSTMQALNQRPFAGRSAAKAFTASGRSARPVARAQRNDRVAEAAALATTLLVAAPAAQAAELFANAANDASTLTFAAGGGAAIVGLGALLMATDPQSRCGVASGSGTRSHLRGANCPRRPALARSAGGRSRWRQLAATSWRR